MGHDGIMTIQASENTLGSLRCTENPYLLSLPMKERMAILRRAKALRPAFFSVGDFTDEFNVDVPVGVWEEILNQLVFLLTL